MYLHVRVPTEAKYQYLIEKHKKGFKQREDPKTFIEYSNNLSMKILKYTI